MSFSGGFAEVALGGDDPVPTMGDKNAFSNSMNNNDNAGGGPPVDPADLNTDAQEVMKDNLEIMREIVLRIREDPEFAASIYADCPRLQHKLEERPDLRPIFEDPRLVAINFEQVYREAGGKLPEDEDEDEKKMGFQELLQKIVNHPLFKVFKVLLLVKKVYTTVTGGGIAMVKSALTNVSNTCCPSGCGPCDPASMFGGGDGADGGDGGDGGEGGDAENQSPNAAANAAMKEQLNAVADHMAEPEVQEQMTELLENDPEGLEEAIENDPDLKALRDSNPLCAALMQDPETMKVLVDPDNLRALGDCPELIEQDFANPDWTPPEASDLEQQLLEVQQEQGMGSGAGAAAAVMEGMDGGMEGMDGLDSVDGVYTDGTPDLGEIDMDAPDADAMERGVDVNDAPDQPDQQQPGQQQAQSTAAVDKAGDAIDQPDGPDNNNSAQQGGGADADAKVDTDGDGIPDDEEVAGEEEVEGEGEEEPENVMEEYELGDTEDGGDADRGVEGAEGGGAEGGGNLDRPDTGGADGPGNNDQTQARSTAPRQQPQQRSRGGDDQARDGEGGGGGGGFFGQITAGFTALATDYVGGSIIGDFMTGDDSMGLGLGEIGGDLGLAGEDELGVDAAGVEDVDTAGAEDAAAGAADEAAAEAEGAAGAVEEAADQVEATTEEAMAEVEGAAEGGAEEVAAKSTILENDIFNDQVDAVEQGMEDVEDHSGRNMDDATNIVENIEEVQDKDKGGDGERGMDEYDEGVGEDLGAMPRGFSDGFGDGFGDGIGDGFGDDLVDDKTNNAAAAGDRSRSNAAGGEEELAEEEKSSSRFGWLGGSFR